MLLNLSELGGFSGADITVGGVDLAFLASGSSSDFSSFSSSEPLSSPSSSSDEPRFLDFGAAAAGRLPGRPLAGGDALVLFDLTAALPFVATFFFLP